MADEGYGASITFASGFFAHILDANFDGMERGDIDVTNFDSPDGWDEFDPSDLTNPGTLSVNIIFDPDEEPPVQEPKETVTFTFPIPPGGSVAATWACDGYMKSMGVAVPLRDKMTAACVLKFSGQPTFTPGS